MLNIEVEENPDNNWNSRLKESGLGTIHQTAEMKINFERMNHVPYFLKFIDNKGNIVGQLLLRKIPVYDKNSIKKRILAKIPIIKHSLLSWKYGPIIFNNNLSNDIFSSLEDFFNKQNSRVHGWTHPLQQTDIISKRLKLLKWGTFMIDLQKPEEELYNNIEKHNGRKNIERSLKRGVEIEEINEKSLIEYSKLNQENDDTIFEQLLQWWKLFKPLGYSGFLARKNGIPTGGLLFSFFNEMILEAAVARPAIDTKERLYSQDLIKWKIIQWGIKNKMKYYNLAGFNPNPKTKKEEGIYRYKKKWGGAKFNFWNISL